MKKIIIKHKNNLITEAISYTNDATADPNISNSRIRAIRTERAASAAEDAAAAAREQGKIKEADELEKRARALRDLLAGNPNPFGAGSGNGGDGGDDGQNDGQNGSGNGKQNSSGNGRQNGSGSGGGRGGSQGGDGNDTEDGSGSGRNSTGDDGAGGSGGAGDGKDDGNGDENNQQKQQKDAFNELKDTLKRLASMGAKAGAKAAINNSLNSRGILQDQNFSEDFKPITKTLDELTDDEFEDIINDTIDAINQIKPLKMSSDIESRVSEIKKDLEDAATYYELDAEDKENTKDEHDKYILSRRELDKYSDYEKSSANVEAFKNMLFNTIKTQTGYDSAEDTSWGALNRKHQYDDILLPGEIEDDKPVKKTVSVQVYLDCSSSFHKDDIEKERSFLSVIDEFVKRGEVEIDLYYFADSIHPGTEQGYKDARRECCTGAWRVIVDNILNTKPTNVLIVTDQDMNSDAAGLDKHAYIPGCAWFMWKNTVAPNLPKYLQGNSGTYEYWLD